MGNTLITRLSSMLDGVTSDYWSFETSEGIDITLGKKLLAGGGNAGSIYLKRTDGARGRINYVGIGAGLSVGPLPASFSSSTKEMFSRGVVLKGGGGADFNDPNDFGGMSLILSGSVGGVDGASITAMYCGSGVDSAWKRLALDAALVVGGTLSPALTQTLLGLRFRGVVVSIGQNKGIQAGAGIMLYVGYITCGEPRPITDEERKRNQARLPAKWQ